MQCLYSGNGYGKGGNACNVDEKLWGSVVESCNCTGKLNPLSVTNSDCQLRCKDSTTSLDCIMAVGNWAKAYSTAFAYDPECRWDPNYRASQEVRRKCASGAS